MRDLRLEGEKIMAQFDKSAHLDDPGDMSELDSRDRLLIGYLEGDLSADERQSLRAELLQDPALRAEFDALKEVMELSKEVVQHSAPPDFVGQVQGRIRQASSGQFFGGPSARRRRLPTRYEAVSAAMLLLIAAVWLLAGSPRDRSLRHVHIANPPPLETSDTPSFRQ